MSLLYALPLLSSLAAGQTALPAALARAAAWLTPRTLAAVTALAAVLLSCFDVGRRGVQPARDEARGWLHWTGVATAVWLALLPLAAQWLMA